MSANAAAEPSERNVPSRRSGRRPASARRARRAPGPAATSSITCGEVSWRSYQSGNASAGHGRQLRREHQPAVGGVVVGDEDDRALRVAVAGLGDDVVGRPLAAAAGGRRAGRPRRRRRSRRPPRRPTAAASARAPRPPRAAASPARPGGGGHQPERHPVGAVRALLLDPGVSTRTIQPLADPLRGPPLARRRPTGARSRRGARRWRAGGLDRTPACGRGRLPCRRMAADPDCLFCKIVAGEIPATRDRRGRPHDHLHGHQPGHARARARDPARARQGPARDRPRGPRGRRAGRPSGSPPRCPSASSADGVNLLNSCGRAAWQTVFHFHLHVIPRYDADPLRLPVDARAGRPRRDRRGRARPRGLTRAAARRRARWRSRCCRRRTRTARSRRSSRRSSSTARRTSAGRSTSSASR